MIALAIYKPRLRAGCEVLDKYTIRLSISIYLCPFIDDKKEAIWKLPKTRKRLRGSKRDLLTRQTDLRFTYLSGYSILSVISVIIPMQTIFVDNVSGLRKMRHSKYS